MKKRNKENGITLIALVITIIVLLILAGITISLTIGQDGIITKAQQAGNNYIEAAKYENEMLKEFESITDGIIQDVTPKIGKLTDIIDASDYGKKINYSANGVTDWKVFYNDGSNVYIISSDYLDNTKIDTAKTGMTTEGTYQAYWAEGSLASPANKSAVAALTNTDNWSAFSTGKGAQSATGGPTLDMWVSSWNANPNTNGIKLVTGNTKSGLRDSTFLYIPHKEIYEECRGYWLASAGAANDNVVWNEYCTGLLTHSGYNYYAMGVRPVVCLQSGITGTVGTSVSID